MRAGTYNTAFTVPDHEFIDDLDRLLPQVDLIGFQEFGDANDRRNLAAAAKKHGFIVFRGKDESCPIAYHAGTFELLDSGSHFLSPSTFVGKEGAGPSTLKEKHLNWIKVRHRVTGRIFYFGNCHLAPSIYLAPRMELHIQQIANIKAWADSKGDNVIFVGDFNIDHKADARTRKPGSPYVKFTPSRIWSTYRTLGTPAIGTHGRRFIDYVFYRENKEAFSPLSHSVLRGYSSDHKPFLATFDVQPVRRESVAFKHIHASSRYDRSLESLEVSVRRQVNDAPLVTFTEVAFEARERVLRKVGREKGYGVVSGDASNADDCAIMFDKKRFELIYSEQFKSATQVIYRTDGVQRDLPYSTIAVFKDKLNGKTFVVSVGHYASGVQGALAKNDQTYRRAIQWRQSTKNTKNRVNKLARQYKADARLVVADWNVDFKKLWVRTLVKAIAPSYRNAWKNVKVAGGTHGKRIIDGTIFYGALKVKGTAKLYRDDASSDHRPYVETFLWR